MMRQRIGYILACFLLTSAVLMAQATQPEHTKKPGRQMAITFNELPAAPDFENVDPEAVNNMILDGLRKHKVKAAGFVVGANLKKGYDIIGRWLNDGHVIGTMTYNLEDINELGAEKFIEEAGWGIDEVEDMLDGFGQKKRYFRFPFLHYGTTKEDKRQIRGYLQSKNHVIAHASVTPSDDLYNFQVSKMGKILDSAQYVVLRDEYLNHVLDEVERSEMLGQDIEGRPVRQILMLRANRLNAIYLDELLTVLEEEGWTFITLDAALHDAVYEHAENYFGLRGLGYLDMIAQGDR